MFYENWGIQIGASVSCNQMRASPAQRPELYRPEVMGCSVAAALPPAAIAACGPIVQGLTIIHFSAQRKHILWDTLGARVSPSLLDRGTRGGVTKTA
jgi:hypothetical protein